MERIYDRTIMWQSAICFVRFSIRSIKKTFYKEIIYEIIIINGNIIANKYHYYVIIFNLFGISDAVRNMSYFVIITICTLSETFIPFLPNIEAISNRCNIVQCIVSLRSDYNLDSRSFLNVSRFLEKIFNCINLAFQNIADTYVVFNNFLDVPETPGKLLNDQEYQ